MEFLRACIIFSNFLKQTSVYSERLYTCIEEEIISKSKYKIKSSNFLGKFIMHCSHEYDFDFFLNIYILFFTENMKIVQLICYLNFKKMY